MTSLAVLLVVVSALAHAGWNLLGKRRNPSAAFFLIANAAGTALLLPVLALFGARARAVPPSVWRSLAATGFFQSLYYVSLAAAYRAGDMSVAYPIARSVPVLLTTAIVAATGGLRSFSVPYAAGCLLVIAGIALVNLRHDPASVPRSSSLRACGLLAALAGVATAGYSTVDSSALTALRASGAFGVTEAAVFYLAAQALSSTIWMSGYALLLPARRKELGETLRRSWRSAALMGVGIYVAYGLVLVAMAFAKNVGYIVAFRQLGVPVGAVLAIVLYREPAPPARIVGIAIAGTGLLLIALG